MKCIKLISLCLVILGAFSCSDHRIFDEVQKFSENEWNSEEPLKFLVNVSDTTSSYNILIHIRNNNSYAYSNLWMYIETSSPNGSTMRDTVEFVLANNSGEWLGKGLGSINTVLVPYKSNIRFPYRGIYSFSLHQAMRQNVIHGVKDIGLRIQERQ